MLRTENRTSRSHPAARSGRSAFLLLAAGVAVAAAGAGCGTSAPDRSVLLITVDTLRADRLGCTGGQPAVTPRIDALAASGTLFEQVHSVAPVTLPTHASVMTGRYPVAHGARDNVAFVLNEQERTLAEILREGGWTTGAFVAAFPVTARFGLGQGFDHFDEALRSEGVVGGAGPGEAVERSAVDVNRAALPWLTRAAESARSGQPFFAWVHYFDPHFPYAPSDEHAGRAPGDAYQGEVAAVDDAVGELLDVLERAGVADRTAVVLTSDHGESLGEHGEETHGFFVYESTVRVPLIVRAPWIEIGARTSARPVSQVDVAPTILDLLGRLDPLEREAPEALHGRSLVPLMRGEELPDRPVLSESVTPWLEFRFSPLRALRDGRWKFVEAPEPELYDLQSDPAESRNLAAENPGEVERLRAALAAEFERAASTATAGGSDRQPTGEEMARLASLGYTGGATGADAAAVPPPDDTLLDPKDGLAIVARHDEASLHFSRDGYMKTVERFRGILEESPDSPSPRLQLGRALLMAGREASGVGRTTDAQNLFEEARRVLTRLVEMTPGSAIARVRLGQAHEVLGQKEEALKQYEAAVTISPTLADARVLLGKLAFRSGDPDRGVEEMRRAVEIAPDNVTYRRDLAGMLSNVGLDSQVEDVMREYVELRPYDASAWFEFGSLLLAKQKVDEAAEAFGRAARIDPQHARARTRLGGLQMVQGKYRAAETGYRAAIESDPNLREARLGLARAVLYQGREEEGVKLLEEFAGMFPNDARVHSYWGLYLLNVKGDEDRAREAFLQAVRIDPRDRLALQGLQTLGSLQIQPRR